MPGACTPRVWVDCGALVRVRVRVRMSGHNDILETTEGLLKKCVELGAISDSLSAQNTTLQEDLARAKEEKEKLTAKNEELGNELSRVSGQLASQGKSSLGATTSTMVQAKLQAEIEGLKLKVRMLANQNEKLERSLELHKAEALNLRRQQNK